MLDELLAVVDPPRAIVVSALVLAAACSSVSLAAPTDISASVRWLVLSVWLVQFVLLLQEVLLQAATGSPSSVGGAQAVEARGSGWGGCCRDCAHCKALVVSRKETTEIHSRIFVACGTLL
jgi:hypothetical protein